jgi:hypothetical protein
MRTRIRSTTVAGLTLSLETPVGVVRGGFARHWGLERPVPGAPRIDIGVRLAWPAPQPGPLNIVRKLGPLVRLAAQFTSHGVVLAELCGSRALRVVRVDARLREGVVECAPEVLAERPCDPLGVLGPILAHHRLAREGAASLLGCVARTPAGVLAFVSESAEVRRRLARRLEKGRPAWLLEGALVVRVTDGAPILTATPWTRVGAGRPGAVGRPLAWHPVHPAPALLAEPLRGRRAAEALQSASALLPGDDVAASLHRAVLDRLVVGERIVRLGFPDDERLLRYAFGGSRAGAPAGYPRSGRWGA